MIVGAEKLESKLCFPTQLKRGRKFAEGRNVLPLLHFTVALYITIVIKMAEDNFIGDSIYEIHQPVEASVRNAVANAANALKRPRGRPRRGRNQTTNTSNAKQPIAQKNFYFRITSDIKLLQLMLELNPFEDNTAWTAVMHNLQQAGFNATLRQCKDRVSLLLGIFNQQNLASINKTGTEEEWNERAELLSQVDTCKNAARIITETSVSEEERSAPLSASTYLPSRQECNEARTERQEIANSLVCDSPSEFTRKTQLPRKRRLEPADEAVIEKIRMNHELAIQKLQADIASRNQEHEMDKNKLQLEQQRIVMENDARKHQSQLLDRIVSIQEANAARDDAMKQEFLKMSQAMMSLVTSVVNKHM